MNNNIIWLDKKSKKMSDKKLFNWLTEICTPIQTGIILDHISLLEKNMLIGYDKTNDDVYVMIIDENENIEILKINKK